ncbi:centrosomal protein [Oopsacas minuta]|uniref:Centrosomal protein n=1 Tax=Oopsacas minuta TaxID=111878 RepID=A0AAV7JCL3_9METZ|nr:centrosomal protein [Oopsacas minuta]
MTSGEDKLLVVGISEGRYFPPRPGHSLVVESTFSGKSLSTDPVPHLTSPHINTELCWEISHKQLQQHRLHRTPLKLILCAMDNRTKTKENIGYLLLDLRTAQQRPAKGHWIRLLNVSYPRLKPEIFVLLTQESATIAENDSPSPLNQPDHSIPQVPSQTRLPKITLDPKHGYFIVEEEREDIGLDKLLFALTFTIQTVLNPQNYPVYGSSHSDATLQLIYSLLGSQIQSETFSLTLGAESEMADQLADMCSSSASTSFKPERITMRILSTRESLHLLLTGHSPVSLTLLSEEHRIGKGEMSLSELSSSLMRSQESLPTHIEKHIRLLPQQADSTALNEQLISLSVSASLRIESSPEHPLPIDTERPETFPVPPPPFPDLDDLHLPPDPPSPLVLSPETIAPPPLSVLPTQSEENLTFCFTIDIPTITNLSLPPSGSYSLHYLYQFFSLTQPIEIPLPHSLPLSHPQRIHSSCCLFDLSTPLSLLMEHTQTEPLQIQLYSQSQPIATSTVLLSSVFSHAVSAHNFSHSMSSPLLSRSGTVAELQINLSLAPVTVNPTHSPIHQPTPQMQLPPRTPVEPVPIPQVIEPPPPAPAPLERVLASEEYKEALQMEMWKEREESQFRDKLKYKETELLQRLAEEWSRQEAGKREELENKSHQYDELQTELRNGLEEVRERGRELDLRDQELIRREQTLSLQLERWEGEKISLRREVSAEYEQKLSIDKGRLVLSEEKIKTLQERLEEIERRLRQRETELQRVMEESRTKPEAKLQAELTVVEAERVKLEQQLSQALQAKQQYRQQWGRALQELAKMRQQEYAVSQAKLKQEQQELEQLRHAYMQREETQGIAQELQKTKQELEHLQTATQHMGGSYRADNGAKAETVESLSLSGSMRENTTKNELESKIARWVEQRNILLQTGVYSRDDPTILRLDENINAALNAKKSSKKMADKPADIEKRRTRKNPSSYTSFSKTSLKIKDKFSKLTLNKDSTSNMKEQEATGQLGGLITIPDMFSQPNNYFEEAAKLVTGSSDVSLSSASIHMAAAPGEAEGCSLHNRDKQRIHKLALQSLYYYSTDKKKIIQNARNVPGYDDEYLKESKRAIENMLEISKTDVIAWRKEAETECLFNHTLSVSLEAATELPLSDSSERANPYCKLGLVSRDTLDRNSRGKLSDLVSKNSPIQVSHISHRNLEPVWKEDFEFELKSDQLLLVEVWDSSGEPGKGAKVKIKDEFVGRCVVDLTTFDTTFPKSTWHELRSHSGKSYRGKIHLTFSFQVRLVESLLSAYRKGRHGAELLEKFLLESARHSTQKNNPFLNGRLPEPFLSISIAIQELLVMSEFESTIARLPLLAKYITKYTYERDELCMTTLVLTSLWQEQLEIIPMQCVQDTIAHLYSIYEHELTLLERTSNVFPNTCSRSIAHLSAVLKSLTQVFKFLKFTRRLSDELSLADILKERILKDIETWKHLEFAKAQPLTLTNQDLDQAATLSDVCYSAAQYLANSWAGYQKPFKKIGIVYFDVAFQKLDSMLAMEIEEFFKTFDSKEHFLVSGKDGEDIKKEIAEKSKGALVIFRLYQGVRDVLNFSSYTKHTPVDGWCLQKLYMWFKPCVLTWMEVTKSIATASLQRLVEYDSGQVYGTHSNIKVTSSAVDTALCFEQCYHFYERLQWPVKEDTFNFVIKLTLVGGDIAKHFAHLLLEKLGKTIKDGLEAKKKFVIDENACMLLNNAYLTQHHLKEIPNRLNWASISKEFEGSEQSPVDTLQRVLDDSIEDVKHCESKMLILLGNYFERQFREIFHNFLTQNYDIEFELAVDPLMQWLVSNIQSSCDTLCQEHFSVLLNELWLRVIKILIEYKDNKMRTEGQYKRLYLSLEVLYQFFYGSGDGLSEEQLCSFEFEILQNYFKLYSLETKELVNKYYCELAKANTKIANKYGSLTFSVYYQKGRGTLNISILRGENFPRMDSYHGTCDPYITVNLLPDPNEMRTIKTKHHKRTLSALFNEEFSVEISLDRFRSHSKVVRLSLWDWDRLSQDDYAGSIYLDIAEVPVIDTLFTDTEGKAKPVTLNFMFPTDILILNVLNDRTTDREAISFLKYIRNLISLGSKICDQSASKSK